MVNIGKLSHLSLQVSKLITTFAISKQLNINTANNMIYDCHKSFDYKEIELYPFDEFKEKCLSFMYDKLGTEKYSYISNTHYFCGDGVHTFTIVDKNTLDDLYMITQSDNVGDMYFSVYIGDTFFYSEENDKHFKTLSDAFDYITETLKS